jgi:ACR3 family arsenite efflux pump ArsB
MEVTKCGQIDAYIAGLILLAAAPCTAMVFGRPPRPPLARMV